MLPFETSNQCNESRDLWFQSQIWKWKKQLGLASKFWHKLKSLWTRLHRFCDVSLWNWGTSYIGEYQSCYITIRWTLYCKIYLQRNESAKFWKFYALYSYEDFLWICGWVIDSLSRGAVQTNTVVRKVLSCTHILQYRQFHNQSSNNEQTV